MGKIIVREFLNLKTASPDMLASIYKQQGYDRYVAWDHFIIDRSLAPEIDAKKFYEIFDKTQPISFVQQREIDFAPNLIDLLCNQRVEAHCDENGVWNMVWEDGTTGSFPPCDPPDPERFVVIIGQLPHEEINA